MSDIKLSLLANSINFVTQAKGLVNNEGVAQTLNFSSRDGAVQLKVPPSLFPFVKPDEIAVVLVSVVKADLSQIDDVPTSSLLLPDTKLVVP